MEKLDISKKIAKNIREILNKKSISPADLARRSKVTTGTISKILSATMNMTIPMAMSIAHGLDCSLSDILKGLGSQTILNDTQPSKKNQSFKIGILSIDKKRYTCICGKDNNVIGQSELNGGLDLVETSHTLYELIKESIDSALPSKYKNRIDLREANLNLVTQSHEFEETKQKFKYFMEKYFKNVILMPDWQITYFSVFDNKPGISLVVDKGTSLSFMHKGTLHKLGGWKFPVYDLGGENWLGSEAIKHTIEASEGYIPMSELARNILSKHGGKIEKITETCFKDKDYDIYSTFADIVMRCYFDNDPAAVAIVKNGFAAVYRSLQHAYQIIGKKVDITISGSLSTLYSKFLDNEKIITPPETSKKALLLTGITEKYLEDYGIYS